MKQNLDANARGEWLWAIRGLNRNIQALVPKRSNVSRSSLWPSAGLTTFTSAPKERRSTMNSDTKRARLFASLLLSSSSQYSFFMIRPTSSEHTLDTSLQSMVKRNMANMRIEPFQPNVMSPIDAPVCRRGRWVYSRRDRHTVAVRNAVGSEGAYKMVRLGLFRQREGSLPL